MILLKHTAPSMMLMTMGWENKMSSKLGKIDLTRMHKHGYSGKVYHGKTFVCDGEYYISKGSIETDFGTRYCYIRETK